jgi:hypothetical protein
MTIAWDDRPTPAEERAQWHRDAEARDNAYRAEGPVDMTESDDSPWRGVPVDEAYFAEPQPRHAAPEPHPPRNCGPLDLPLLRGSTCPTCGTRIPDDESDSDD